MRGAYVGHGQFPYLEKLTSFKIYLESKKWTENTQTRNGDLLQRNIESSDIELGVPRDVSGGNTLILRILDHSPNLSKIEISSGSVMTTKVETWFLRHLFHWRVNLPKFEDYHCSVPLHEEIIKGFLSKSWPLKNLHIKTIPGAANAIRASSLHEMLGKYHGTLKHLELFLMGGGDSAQEFISGRNLPILESIELWGFTGDFTFLRDMGSLRKAVIGAITEVEYQRILNYFEVYPLPEHIKLELKSNEDFLLRLDQPPRTPFIVAAQT